MIRCKCWEKTYMVARPTSSMKKGWLYRTSYDEKNHEIALVMIQIEWSSRSSEDSTSDDPDREPMMITSDDIDRVMIYIQWWYPVMI